MHHDDNIDSYTEKPEIVTMYNTKGGVTVFDKLCMSYDCAKSTRRWLMVVFFSAMNIAAINTCVIYSSNNPNTNMLTDADPEYIFSRDAANGLFSSSVSSDELSSTVLKENHDTNIPERQTKEEKK
ncbi:hypothetical protein ILUMI_13138 [Ignelater luminosus]|uniref:PiggyBac transposable element-derived protein domain-containing protein n=1 Tax=Ignelater luminosus TaxID=2038154 RepID=A0A8K0D1E8_IGNLU|nr:hypothetical protein ILUMI_13138 [Ignelater luminosus]